jgi:hypothetical protein
VIGFEMVAGQLPFGEGTVATILVRHATTAAPSLLDLRPACPSHLATVIARCLEKSPVARWGSMIDVRRALVHPSRDRDAGDHGLEIASTGAVPKSVVRAAGYLLVAAGGLVVDAVGLLPWPVSPLVLAAVVLALIIEVGTWRVHGGDWHHPFRVGKRRSTPPSAPTPAATARFGAWATVVARALADRVAIRGVVARLPRAERREIADLLPVLDHLTAEAADAAEQLAVLDRSGSDALADADDRRRELSARLDRAAAAVAGLRKAVRSADADGVARIQGDMRRFTGAGLGHAPPLGDRHGDQQEAGAGSQ